VKTHASATVTQTVESSCPMSHAQQDTILKYIKHMLQHACGKGYSILVNISFEIFNGVVDDRIGLSLQ
jgi:hypothetical protein